MDDDMSRHEGELREVLAMLQPGTAVEIDYRGSVPGDPRIALHCSEVDVVNAQGPNGWLDAPGRTRWVWPPSDQPDDRRERIIHALLAFLRSLRDAHAEEFPDLDLSWCPRWELGDSFSGTHPRGGCVLPWER